MVKQAFEILSSRAFNLFAVQSVFRLLLILYSHLILGVSLFLYVLGTFPLAGSDTLLKYIKFLKSSLQHYN